MKDFFEEFNFDEAEKVPASLMNEVTVKPDAIKKDIPNLSELTAHTEAPIFSDNFGTGQPAQGQVIPPTGGAQQLNAGNMLTPEMAASFFNILIPAAMAILINRFTKMKVIKSQFEASQKEVEILKPVLKAYLDSVNFTVDSPAAALVITVAFIYGSKGVEAMNGQTKGTIKTADFTPPTVDGTTIPRTQRKQQEQGAKPRKPRPSGMTYKKNPPATTQLF